MQSPPPGPPPPQTSNTATASFIFSLTSTPTVSPTVSPTESWTSSLTSTQTPTSTYYPSLTSTPSYLAVSSGESSVSGLNLTTILGASSGSIVSVLTLIAGFIHRKKLRGTCCGKRISITVEPENTADSGDSEKAEDSEKGTSEKVDDNTGRSDSQVTAALAIAAITKIATDHKHHGHS